MALYRKKQIEQITDSLDLTLSAELEEKSKTPRFLPWEVALASFYFLTLVTFLVVFGPENLQSASDSINFWTGMGMYSLLGVVLFAAIIQNAYFKENDNRRRSILLGTLEGSKGAHLITDDNRKTIFSNKRFQKMLKRKRKIAILDLITQLADEKDRHRVEKYIEDAYQKPYLKPIVFALLSTDDNGNNGMNWCELSVRPIKGWAGYVHWRLDNITNDYTAKTQLSDERDRLIDFMDSAPIGFFSINEKGAFTYANDTFLTWIAGEDKDLFEGDFHLHDILAEGAEENFKPYDLIPNEETPYMQRGELKMKGYDGRIFLASVYHNIIEEENGTISSQTIMRDLTPERAWKRALKQSEDRFQRFFEEAPLGIVSIDKNAKISECNDAFSMMLRIKYHDIVDQNLSHFISEQEMIKIRKVVETALKEKKAVEPVEIIFNQKEDTPITTQMFASSYMGDSGVILHFIDLTEQKNLESQFTQSQKMQAVGQLAGGVAHDFNNLLTAMIGFCDLLLTKHRAGDPSFGDIMQIKQNANRAANLVRQLLAFSRKQTLQPKKLDVTDVVTELSHLLRRLIGANIVLDINHGRDLWPVKVDEGQMEQVLINLVVNARDAMPEGGTVKITTENKELKRRKNIGTETLPAGQWVSIQIEDTGTGIPSEIIERIFDPFFTTKEVGAGTGLGLSTVYGIIRQTNGYISVESIEGKGTKFTIYLPKLQKEDEEIKPVEEEKTYKVEDLTGSAKIMLVEDEDAVRSFSMRALTAKGYEVLDANCGEAGLELFQKTDQKIDLLISDVIMPGMDGIEMVENIRKINPDLTVVFMSGYTEDKYKDNMGENTYFLPKPFTLRQLAEKVKDVLDKQKEKI